MRFSDAPRLLDETTEKLIYISLIVQKVNGFRHTNVPLQIAQLRLYLHYMNIYLGADHQGFYLKEQVFAYLVKHGYTVHDVGDTELDPNDDFPDFAQLAATQVIGDSSKDPRAILICGGGQGMAMAANRFRGIRASVIWDAYEAKMTRHDNDSNVLCLPARIFEDQDEAAWQGIVETWLNTPFAAVARYKRRNAQIDEL